MKSVKVTIEQGMYDGLPVTRLTVTKTGNHAGPMEQVQAQLFGKTIQAIETMTGQDPLRPSDARRAFLLDGEGADVIQKLLDKVAEKRLKIDIEDKRPVAGASVEAETTEATTYVAHGLALAQEQSQRRINTALIHAVFSEAEEDVRQVAFISNNRALIGLTEMKRDVALTSQESVFSQIEQLLKDRPDLFPGDLRGPVFIFERNASEETIRGALAALNELSNLAVITPGVTQNTGFVSTSRPDVAGGMERNDTSRTDAPGAVPESNPVQTPDEIIAKLTSTGPENIRQ